MDALGLSASPAPLALPPAPRAIRPVFVEAVQDPLLPWLAPEPEPPREAPISAGTRHAVSTLTAALVEVLRGRRPPAHLEPHADAGVLGLVGRLLADGAMPSLRLASLHLSQPARELIEAAARLELGSRSCALALGYARTGPAWRLVAVELCLDAGGILRAA